MESVRAGASLDAGLGRELPSFRAVFEAAPGVDRVLAPDPPECTRPRRTPSRRRRRERRAEGAAATVGRRPLRRDRCDGWSRPLRAGGSPRRPSGAVEGPVHGTSLPVRRPIDAEQPEGGRRRVHGADPRPERRARGDARAPGGPRDGHVQRVRAAVRPAVAAVVRREEERVAAAPVGRVLPPRARRRAPRRRCGPPGRRPTTSSRTCARRSPAPRGARRGGVAGRRPPGSAGRRAPSGPHARSSTSPAAPARSRASRAP
jgi:hypothetical protein